MSWSSPFFTKEEMTCQCGCGTEAMDERFIERLTSLRADWGNPMTVTSAYRCPSHPIEAKKQNPGAHSSGRAVDIAIDREDAYNLLCAALGHGFTGLGFKQKGSARFIHIDDLTKEEGWPRPTIWSY
tara:strand:- start:8163 stop:8543 length:381 start_codon:yes stop_codon:yes gene_type:complete